MKPTVDEVAQRLLTLLKLDAKRLYERIRYRAPEYLFIFSSKRTRDHFGEVFKNRYKDVSIEDLKMVGQEVIVSMDGFYSLVDEMHWYVNSTEDMPNTVDDKINKYITKLTPVYETLCLYIDADLGISSEEAVPIHEAPVIESDFSENEFEMDSEIEYFSDSDEENTDFEFEDEETPVEDEVKIEKVS